MTLRDWMDKHKKSNAWLAFQIDMDRSHVSRMRRGLTKPSLQTMIAIKDLTNGEVNLESWGKSNE